MKGSLRTVRVCKQSPQTNFNDWADPKYKLPPKRETNSVAVKSSDITEDHNSDESLTSTASHPSIKINEMRNQIRYGQPLLSKKEIRNIRLPFHESLLQNLKEDGFLLTHVFIQDLIAIDDIFHKDLETDFNLKDRPILKFQKSVLIPLATALMKAESAKLKGEKNQEATAFLDVAILFSNSEDKSWIWVAEEMFEQCMEIVDSNCTDLQLKATAKYFYALFLFNELHNLIEAKMQAECAIAISDSRYWTINDKEDKKGNTLYFESCILLHKIFLEMAQNEMIGQNTEEAIKFCRKSLLLAKMIDSKLAEVNALQQLINIYLSVEQVYSVPDLLQSYMKLCTDMRDFERLCEGYILNARYQDYIGNKVNVIQDMKKLLQTAEQYQIKNMVAVAHHKLAIYCMLGGNNKNLLEHAIEAYMCHMDFKKNRKDIEEARCLVGIAQALEIMSDYTSLVAEANSRNLIDLSILIRWKNWRIPFFENNMVFLPELTSNRELLDRIEKLRLETSLMDASNRKRKFSNLVSSPSKQFLSKQYSESSLNSRGNLYPSTQTSSLANFDVDKPRIIKTVSYADSADGNSNKKTKSISFKKTSSASYNVAEQ